MSRRGSRRGTLTPTRGLWALGVIAVAVAVFAAGPVTDRRNADAKLTATATDGSFTQSNSRDGLPLFTAAGIAPGGSVDGTVTLKNTGTLAGRFSLSAADVSDSVGSGGGVLSDHLRLSVRDVTAPAQPLTVYAGPLGAMGPHDLGTFAAAEARTYEFVASLPDGGTPATATSGDNAFQGARMSVRYVWTAVADEPTSPAAPPPGSPPSATEPAPDGDTGERVDVRDPRLRVRVPRVQRVFHTRRLAIRVHCSERCRIRAGGWLRAGRGQRLRLPRSHARAHAGSARLVRIRVPRRQRRMLRHALERRRTVTIRLAVRVADRAGNSTVARRTLRVRAR